MENAHEKPRTGNSNVNAPTVQSKPYGTLLVARDADELAQVAADRILAWAIESKGLVRVALSGGETPRGTYQELAGAQYVDRFPWTRVHWYWGDERFVPPDSPESNFRMAREAMLSVAPIPRDNIHPIPTVGISPDEAAAEYEKLLLRFYTDDRREGGPLFDICLLGLGEDGHTASLIPGTSVLDDFSHWVAVDAKGRPNTRITLTYPALNLSRHTAFLVSGTKKRKILGEVIGGASTVPAARLKPIGDLLFIADRAAAGG